MTLHRPALIAAALAATFLSSAVLAQGARTTGPEPARPADATANKPSDSGAQTTLPRGAVTGAGQPQGATQASSDIPKATRAKSKTKAKKRTAKSRAAATRPAREVSAGETPK